MKVLGQDDYHGARLAFLPEEKRARVRLALDQFSDREQELLEEAVENEQERPAAELSRVQQEKRAAVAQMLSSQELEMFDLWFSPAAARSREAVFGMEATEEEFLKVYEIEREAELAGITRQDLGARLRDALGEDRYHDYVRSQDPGFRELYALTVRLKLPRTMAVELHGYERAAETERASVESDPNLSPEQRRAAHEAIAIETQRAFKEVLGDRAFRQYARRAAGRAMRVQ
jgi:hypothetical protein